MQLSICLKSLDTLNWAAKILLCPVSVWFAMTWIQVSLKRLWARGQPISLEFNCSSQLWLSRDQPGTKRLWSAKTDYVMKFVHIISSHQLISALLLSPPTNWDDDKLDKIWWHYNDDGLNWNLMQSFSVMMQCWCKHKMDYLYYQHIQKLRAITIIP